jgi:fructokinase
LTHPELGHMFVPRHPSDSFEGVCPAHGDCLEGLASGPAVARRWNEAPASLPTDHPAWELESYYLAEAVANLTAVLSPEVVVLGGGVMSVEGLLESIRVKTRTRANGYYSSDELNNRIADYVVSPGLGKDAGVVGAFAMGGDLIGTTD